MKNIFEFQLPKTEHPCRETNPHFFPSPTGHVALVWVPRPQSWVYTQLFQRSVSSTPFGAESSCACLSLCLFVVWRMACFNFAQIVSSLKLFLCWSEWVWIHIVTVELLETTIIFKVERERSYLKKNNWPCYRLSLQAGRAASLHFPLNDASFSVFCECSHCDETKGLWGLSFYLGGSGMLLFGLWVMH